MQVLQGYTQVTLADAQSITVLRAVQKGNAPSLVAALACDTAAMYQAAAQAFNHFSISSQGSKAAKYAEWKQLVFQGYMYAFTGVFTRHSCMPPAGCLLPSTSQCVRCIHSTSALQLWQDLLHAARRVVSLPDTGASIQDLPCMYLNSVSTPTRGVCMCSAMQCSLVTSLLHILWQLCSNTPANTCWLQA